MYLLTQIGFIVLTLLCLGLILKQLRQALSQADLSVKQQKRIWVGTCLGLLVWLSFLSLVSLSGFFSNFSGFPPRIGIVLIVPLITILILTFSRNINSLLKVIPPQSILYLQSFRVIVELLLWLLFIQNILPVQMTFEGQNWDILVGLTAPVVAYFSFVRRSWPRVVVILWNVLGLLLLANIVIIAMLSMPTIFRVFMNDPANTIVAQFPFIWLPGVLVPIAYSMHFFSLKQQILSR